MNELVKCITCDTLQPERTPIPHPRLWDPYRVTACIKCGGVWARRSALPITLASLDVTNLSRLA